MFECALPGVAVLDRHLTFPFRLLFRRGERRVGERHSRERDFDGSSEDIEALVILLSPAPIGIERLSARVVEQRLGGCQNVGA